MQVSPQRGVLATQRRARRAFPRRTPQPQKRRSASKQYLTSPARYSQTSNLLSTFLTILAYPYRIGYDDDKPSQTHQSHPEIVKRLAEGADGHLRGVIEMIEGGRPCLDIAQQLHAVEKAIAQAKKTLIQDHHDHCLERSGPGRSGVIAAVDRRVQGKSEVSVMLAIPKTGPIATFLAQVIALVGTGLVTVACWACWLSNWRVEAGAVLGTALAIKMIVLCRCHRAGRIGIAERVPRRAMLVALDLVRAAVAVFCLSSPRFGRSMF